MRVVERVGKVATVFLYYLLITKYSLVSCRPCSISVGKRESVGTGGVRGVRTGYLKGSAVHFVTVNSSRH